MHTAWNKIYLDASELKPCGSKCVFHLASSIQFLVFSRACSVEGWDIFQTVLTWLN